MPEFETARHQLPLLAVSQAQKEITHNEALARIDALLHPVVQDQLAAPPMLTDLDFGKCWLITGLPTGDWAGKPGQIAIWVSGSWRYSVACEGMRIRLLSSGLDLVYIDGLWVAPPTIPIPMSGTLIDVEARAAITALLEHLRALGFVTN